ncbi:FdhD protein [Verrucomicrobium sp. GAS474]|uniref:formate dehydrogenase accessory sulfurtransferase FdhD n=1 Tax=Verrucomicrobium sp. GAS474 TaxID=1882831 RepID=UPI00087C20BB|nr:formate dehydrogenase accessory sulfurtransferase FdhD [Verrucomicrobium sp. GAS474]SDU15561.1 FdhD protein [Verrucomicrobium sp. GAS474]
MTENGYLSWRVEKIKLPAIQDGSSAPVSLSRNDVLAVEEPLEIQVEAGGVWRTITITMRTPGDDAELAAGFLAGEGILRSPGEIAEIDGRTPHPGRQIRLRLSVAEGAPAPAPALIDRLDRAGRLSYATSACGVCGKASLRGVDESLVEVDSPDAGVSSGEGTVCVPLLAPFSAPIPAALVADLPRRLRAAQAVFERTGGLHAAGLFDSIGELPLLVVREDVGRHNAVDKVVGNRLLTPGGWPAGRAILVVSGRASFELVQKAVAARIPMLVSVGAPSSLAAETARHFGLTLVGFTRAEGFNIYSGGERIAVVPEAGGLSRFTEPATLSVP